MAAANETKKLSILLKGAGVQTQGEVEVHVWTRKQALRKGLIWWLACWGIAVLALPIPLIHFIAVPLFLALGPVAGFGMYKLYFGAADIESGRAACPSCGKEVQFPAAAERWPMTLKCLHCQMELIATPDMTERYRTL